jgi:hypothetical protein
MALVIILLSVVMVVAAVRHPAQALALGLMVAGAACYRIVRTIGPTCWANSSAALMTASVPFR